MWHQKPNNGIFPVQMPGPSLVSQSIRIEGVKGQAVSNVPENDFVSETSRKRKLMSQGQPGNDISDGMPQSFSEDNLPNESYQQKVGRFSGMNVRGNFPRSYSNQIPLSTESSARVPQFGRNQSQSMNSFNSPIPFSAANERFSNLNSRIEPPSFRREEPFTFLNSPSRRLPDSQFPSYHIFSQIDARHPFHPDPSNTCMGTDQSGQGLKDGVNVGGMNYIAGGNSSLEPLSKASESLSSLGVARLKNEMFDRYVELDRSFQDKAGFPVEVKQSGQSIDVAETIDTSRMKSDSLEHSLSTRPETDQLCEVRASVALDNGATVINKDQSFGDCNAQLIEHKEGSSIAGTNHPSVEEVSPKNYSLQACDLNGETKSQAEKFALTTVEKLWDGSLQLNSSTIVSAIAFFKSGEKTPEANWFKSVEVKGKVRLEAFEKFIQELPRSRSRGLMVTSLCWKVGSSEIGLTGMKEVAKGYRNGKKVGYAQLSEGIDLYVCPRSETIFTILAKHGFFKGMAAVEDDQDSLIGCVVWKRKLKSSDSISNKGEVKSDQPLNTSIGVIQGIAEANTPLIKPGGGSCPPKSEKASTLPESTGNMSSDNRKSSSSEVQLEAGNSLTSINQNEAPLVAESSPSISMPLTPILLDSTSQDTHFKEEVETPTVRSYGLEKPVPCIELPRPLPGPPQNINIQDRPAPDDDDLPEFDFSVACGVPQHPLSSYILSSNNVHAPAAGLLDKKYPVEATNVNGPFSAAVQVAHLMKSSIQDRPQFPNLPVSSGTTNLQTYPAKKLENCEYPSPQVSFLVTMATAQGIEVSNQGISKQANNAVLGPQKNLWDDDDDMPEWCPPDMEHGSEPPPVTSTRTSISCNSSLVPNPKFDKMPPCPPGPPPLPPGPPPLPPGPPRPPPTLPPSVPIYPPLPPGLPPDHYRNQHCPTSISEKPAQARPIGVHAHIGSSSLMGLTSDSMPRPPANMVNVRPPHNPAGWRGWRP